MKKLMMTAAFAMTATASYAETVSEQVITQLQAQGFTHIEVKHGPTQVKVEAYRDGMQFEAVYDAATGQVLMQEFGAADNNDTQQGVSVRDDDRDFVSDSN
ncbi:MAG: PepSY domain-containing protein, partial [Yoonia sp.]|nr:PepSY domain-containing protein [Yoonia sp.]